MEAIPSSADERTPKPIPKPRAGFFTGNCLDFWATLPISLRRAIGLWFDVVCLLLLWCMPDIMRLCLFRPSDPALLGSGYGADFRAPFSIVEFLCTPIPLISLRFFCKSIMRSPTPGELLSGFSSVSGGKRLVGAIQHVAFAICQYLVFSVAAALAMLPAQGASSLACLLFVNWSPLILGGAVAITFAFILFSVMRAAFIPFGDGNLEGAIDRLLRLKVVSLGEERHISIEDKSDE